MGDRSCITQGDDNMTTVEEEEVTGGMKMSAEPEKKPSDDKKARDKKASSETPKKKSGKPSKDKEKKTKTKKKAGLLGAVADKLLSKIPRSKDKESKPKPEKEKDREKTVAVNVKKDRTSISPATVMALEEETELVKNVKDYVSSVADIDKTQKLNNYFLTTLMKISPPSAAYTSFHANPKKNQNPDVWCVEASRVKLNTAADAGKSDYIHANYVKFDGLKRVYIATQHPIKATVDDFYAMLFAEEVDTVVSLSAKSDQMPNYFPAEKNAFENLPNFCVTCKAVKEDVKYSSTEYTLEVLPNGCSNSLTVRLLKYNSWGKYQVPVSPKVVTWLVKAMKKARGPVVVQCETGVNQSAALIFVDATLGLLDAGQTPTIESVFRDLRTQRHSALSQRLQFIHAVYVVLVVLKTRAAMCKQTAECLKWVDTFESAMADEFGKSKSTQPSDPKASSPTLDQTIG